jgi:arylsulfatase A-like enzyme
VNALKACCLLLVVLGCLLASLANASEPPIAGTASADPPNVLWIMLDDGRADSLGCYDAPWAKTLNLDTLAANGVRFKTVVVQNPVCRPARTCMQTGLYAHQTGVIAMGGAPKQVPAYRADLRKKLPHLLQPWHAAGIQPINIGKVHAFAGDFKSLGSA